MLKLTNKQGEILNSCMENYIKFLDSQIDKLEDKAVVKFAENRKTNCEVIAKVTFDALLKAESEKDLYNASQLLNNG